jgi:outer membrane protein TolC
MIMRKLSTVLLIFIGCIGLAQEEEISTVLRFDEYLGYVKRFHPIVKQAELVIDESQAKLMKSRGAFDPKIEVDYDRKKFKESEYWDKLNATFKIPTWYGIELKANFEENTGDFLNPEGFVPEGGLYSAGVKISALEGLLINDRMAQLKQAKLFREQAKADRDLLVNNILFEASLVYFKWLQAYNENELFKNFLDNARLRFQGIKRGAELGQFAPIDSTEAKIVVNDRILSFEQTRIKLVKATLELSTFLWLENNIPVQLQEGIVPDINSEPIIDDTFNINTLVSDSLLIDNNPKLLSLDYKLQNLEVDRRLKANRLLPKLDLEYNFLTETGDVINSYNTANYKAGVNFSLPLFLRKERGDLNVAKLKVQDTEFEIDATRVNLLNKIDALRQELDSYIIQNDVTQQMVRDTDRLLRAEIRKFQVGESSLFLVNTREAKLIESQLKAIKLQNKFFETKAKLFNSIAINPDF